MNWSVCLSLFFFFYLNVKKNLPFKVFCYNLANLQPEMKGKKKIFIPKCIMSDIKMGTHHGTNEEKWKWKWCWKMKSSWNCRKKNTNRKKGKKNMWVCGFYPISCEMYESNQKANENKKKMYFVRKRNMWDDTKPIIIDRNHLFIVRNELSEYL